MQLTNKVEPIEDEGIGMDDENSETQKENLSLSKCEVSLNFLLKIKSSIIFIHVMYIKNC